MEPVQIAQPVVLEAMLRKLGLPCPVYEHDVAEDSITAKVMFYPSMGLLRSSSHPHSVYSYPSFTLEAATNDAARQAIEYMEKVQKKRPTSFNDADLEKEKKAVKLAYDRLQKAEEKVTRTSNQLIQTAVTCDSYIQTVGDVTHRINQIVLNSLSVDCTVAQNNHRDNLLQIQSIAISLSQHTADTVAMHRAAGPSPYGEETIDGCLSPESYES